MARPDSPIDHAGVRGHAGKVDTRAVHRARRRPPPDRAKWTWGSSAVAEEGDTTVEVDEAIEADVWKLSIDMPACHISVQIDGSGQLDQLLEFLRRVDHGHPLGPFGEFRVGPPWTTWVWDDETSGRLFIWLNRASKHSMRAVLDGPQVDCIRSALAEATRPH